MLPAPLRQRDGNGPDFIFALRESYGWKGKAMSIATNEPP